MTASANLRAALRRGMVVAPGAFDCLSARLVERAGFGAVYMTGFGATASRLGTPDIGLLGMSEMLTHARDMGFSLVLHAVSGLFAAAHALQRVYGELRERGSSASLSAEILGYEAFCEIVDLGFHQRLDDRHG